MRITIQGKPVPKQSFRYSQKGSYSTKRVTDYAFTVKWDGGSRYIRRGDITQTDREYQPLNNEMLNIDWKLGTWEIVK